MLGNISISGFSGFDTDEIIGKLLEIEKTSLNRLEQQKTIHLNTKEIWAKVNTKLLSLRTSLNTLLDRLSWESVKSEVSDSSKISATTVSGAVPATYNFEVTKLATHSYTEGAKINKVNPNEPLNLNGTIAETLKGGIIGVEPTLMDDSYGWFVIRVRQPSTTSNEFAGTVVSEDRIYWDANTDTISNLINKVNRSSAGVTMFYDEVYNAGLDEYEGKFVVTANTPGEYILDIRSRRASNYDDHAANRDEYAIPNAAYHLARHALKIGDTFQSNPPTYQSKVIGEKAEVTLNGVEINPDTNSYTVNGVTINFMDVGSSTVTVSEDTEKILENVREFIEQYNSMQDYLDEVSSMEMGNRGALAGNFLIQNLRSRLSTFAMSAYNWGAGAENTQLASQLGITLGDYRSENKNHLLLDESKFLSALADDPQGVQNFFGYNKNGTNPSSGLKNAGMAYDMRTYLQPLTEYRGLIFNERNALDNLIKNIDDRIERELLRFDRREEQLRRQFAIMEQALQALNSQNTYFESQLAQLSNNRKK